MYKRWEQEHTREYIEEKHRNKKCKNPLHISHEYAMNMSQLYSITL